MKNRNVVQNCSLAALALACMLPVAACGEKKPADGPAAQGSVGYNQPQQGYPPPQGYPQQPPPQGYPQQPPPQGYPQQPPPQGYPQQPPPQGYPQQPPPGGQPAPGTQPMGGAVTTDPNQLAALFAQAAAGAQAMMQQPGSVVGDPIEAGIRLSAAKNAPGMQPEGQMAKGNLAEGGHLEFMVPMQAGKCYTVIGFAMPGTVSNLDLHLLAPPLYNFLAGEDATADNMPVIGKGTAPMCPIVPIALNYKIDINAKKGAGLVGAQVFSKAK